MSKVDESSWILSAWKQMHVSLLVCQPATDLNFFKMLKILEKKV